MSDFNERIIAEFRTNGGHVLTADFGADLVLLHTTGAKSHELRVSPLWSIRQSDGSWLVLAANGGSPTHPAWYHNLLAHPEAEVEFPTPAGVERLPVVASPLPPTEYDEAWQRFAARSSAIDTYRQRAGGRLLPVVRLVP